MNDDQLFSQLNLQDYFLPYLNLLFFVGDVSRVFFCLGDFNFSHCLSFDSFKHFNNFSLQVTVHVSSRISVLEIKRH